MEEPSSTTFAISSKSTVEQEEDSDPQVKRTEMLQNEGYIGLAQVLYETRGSIQCPGLFAKNTWWIHKGTTWDLQGAIGNSQRSHRAFTKHGSQGTRGRFLKQSQRAHSSSTAAGFGNMGI